MRTFLGRSKEKILKSGLKKKSVVDCFQIRPVSHNGFAEKIGEISNDEIDQIKRSIPLFLTSSRKTARSNHLDRGFKE